MKQYSHILFDFDGTIADCRVGVVESITHAVRRVSEKIVSDNDVVPLIGTPIERIMEILLQSSDRALLHKAIDMFRSRYMDKGISEYMLYPGITELLPRLKIAGKTLYIVSNKLTEPLLAIVDRAGISHYFQQIRGIDGTGSAARKQKDVHDLLVERHLQAEETCMIGDTQKDIGAGKANGLYTIGVTYGFGEKNGLQLAGADIIVNTVDELGRFLMPRIYI